MGKVSSGCRLWITSYEIFTAEHAVACYFHFGTNIYQGGKNQDSVFSLTDCLLMRKISSHSLLQGKSYEFILIKRCSCPTPLTKAAKPCSNIWRLSTERQKPPELNKKNSQVQGDTEIFTNRTISPKKRLSLSRTEKRVSTLT